MSEEERKAEKPEYAASAEKRYGDSLKAIDTLNKMGGLYAPEEHNINTNAEPIKISFE